ncbi:unnamed protein product [Vicia faba]|uniref:Uncharacterized protein n=1 Tax=Vicia faba TaxID=3906 RepID=A0AAV0Z7I7_VICFA|nr:unnamed protein product [Vicia faba]
MTSFSYENRKGSGKKLKVHFDLPEDEDYPIDHIKMKHSSSSISSESSLDSDDSDKDIDKFEESNNGGYGSPVWSFQGGGSVIHSPPIQLMSTNSNLGYDPNRIPSSAFGPKPVNPMEWSVASNESLFSLHFGNNSFSREQFLAFKSGELSRTNDLNATSSTMKLVQEVNSSNDENEVVNERTSLSSDSSHDSTDTLDKTTNVISNVDDKRTSNVEEITLDETHDNQNNEEPNEAPDEEPKNYATNVSYRSVESDMSNRSFQFPILTAEGVRTSSETVESEKKEKNEKQQSIQKLDSSKSETKQKQRVRGWRCCSCFSCSPCY